jgi:DNA-binding NarL/FixJ family response regulator
VQARAALRAALSTFERLGAHPWTERARRELAATGLRARRRVPETRNELTAQELQVAILVADGATNREAAAQLYVSPKTIETHLSHIYRTLGVRSRTELARHPDLTGHHPVNALITQVTPQGRGNRRSHDHLHWQTARSGSSPH